MKYSKTTLPNGLRVLVAPMPTLQSATVTIWVGTGSRYEDENINGISHFLEHMVFKGGRKYKTSKAVSLAVDSFGGEFNAGTSKEWTNFYIRSHVDKINTAFDVLSDIVLYPLIQPKELEKEKGVIVEEIGMYEDNPRQYVWDIYERLMFDGHSMGRDILGTRDIVRSLNREDFERYRQKFYYPENIVVSIAGGITVGHALKLADKYLGGIKQTKGTKKLTEFKKIQTKPRIVLLNQPREQGNFVLGYYGNKINSKDQYTEAILETILGGGQSSRLWREIREKRGMAYSVFFDVNQYIDTGYMSVYAGVDPKRIDEAIKVVLRELYKLTTASHGINAKELTKAKEYFKGHFALSLEHTGAVSSFFGRREVLIGQIRKPEEVVEGIEKVTIEDVVRLAKKTFIPRDANLAVIGPYKDEGKFEKLLQ